MRINRVMADAFVSEVPPTLCSQGGIPTATIAPLDCPQTKQGSSANTRGTSPASERLANHTSGSEPATAKTVESVRERIIVGRPAGQILDTSAPIGKDYGAAAAQAIVELTIAQFGPERKPQRD